MIYKISKFYTTSADVQFESKVGPRCPGHQAGSQDFAQEGAMRSFLAM